MFGKLLGALVGAKAADRIRGGNETTGALVGVATVALARRFGLAGIVAAAAGGYALNRYNEKRRARLAAAPAAPASATP